FAGVDPIAVLDIQQIIRFLKERGIGVLITDHNVRETLGICDHAYIINQGSVLAFGKPQEIIYNDDVRKVYLGENFRLWRVVSSPREPRYEAQPPAQALPAPHADA